MFKSTHLIAISNGNDAPKKVMDLMKFKSNVSIMYYELSVLYIMYCLHVCYLLLQN